MYKENKITKRQATIIYDIEWVLQVRFTGKTYDDAMSYISTHRDKYNKVMEERRKHESQRGNFQMPIRKGSDNPMSKLNEDVVREIKVLLNRGETVKELHNKFGVSLSAIYDIKNGNTWKHVKVS